MKQWQCGACGQWVAWGWWRHSHARKTEATLTDMIEARKRGEDLTEDAKVETYMRDGTEPTREEP